LKLSRKNMWVLRFIKYFAIAFFINWILFLNPFVRIIASKDISLPYKVFLEIRKFREIRKGDYVEIYVGDMKLPIRKGKVKYLIKQVVCVHEDKLVYRDGNFYCNGKLLGKVHKEAPSKPFKYNGTIPDGFFFVMGKHERSFDSRYIGLIPKERIVAKLIPLF